MNIVFYSIGICIIDNSTYLLNNYTFSYFLQVYSETLQNENLGNILGLKNNIMRTKFYFVDSISKQIELFKIHSTIIFC